MPDRLDPPKSLDDVALPEPSWLRFAKSCEYGTLFPVTGNFKGKLPEGNPPQKEAETGMKLTLNQAAKETGRAKSTISKAIKSGKLSADPQEDGSYQIDTSELFRVFPATSHEQDKLPEGNPVETGGNAHENTALQAELEALRRQVETLNLEREREREQLTDQIEDLRQRLDREGAERAKLTALLTDQRQQPAAAPEPQRKGFFARMMKG